MIVLATTRAAVAPVTTPAAAISECPEDRPPEQGAVLFTGVALSGEGGSLFGESPVSEIVIDEVRRDGGSGLVVGDVVAVDSSSFSGCWGDWTNFEEGQRYLIGLMSSNNPTARADRLQQSSGRRTSKAAGAAIVSAVAVAAGLRRRRAITLDAVPTGFEGQAGSDSKRTR